LEQSKNPAESGAIRKKTVWHAKTQRWLFKYKLSALASLREAKTKL